MEDLSLHILDIAENAIRASARKIEIGVCEDEKKDLLTIEVKDDGRGMDEETMKRALDPFFTTRTAGRVGLGLPLLAQSARQSGGDIELASQLGGGTTVRARFRYSHPDRKPLGDMQETMVTLVAGNPEIQFIYEHRDGDSVYRLASSKMRLENK